MSDTDRRQFMKLTGAGAAGAALASTGTGVSSDVTTLEDGNEYFIAFSDSLRLGIAVDDPNTDGIELTSDQTNEWALIFGDGDTEEETWSAGLEDITLPDVINLVIDFFDRDDFDLRDTVEEFLTSEDLQDVDQELADFINDLDLRELLAPIDTEQLLTPLAQLAKGMDLKEPWGRQFINELGWEDILGTQGVFSNPDDLSDDDIDDLRFHDTYATDGVGGGGEVVSTAGWIEGTWIEVDTPDIFGKTLDDDLADHNIDALLTDPGGHVGPLLEDMVETTFLVLWYGSEDGNEIRLSPGTDEDEDSEPYVFLTRDAPRFDRILDYFLSILNSDEVEDMLFDDDDDDDDDDDEDASYEVTCTGDGPEVEEIDDDDEDQSVWETIKEFLVEELGLDEETIDDTIDPEPIEDFIAAIEDNLLPDDLLETVGDLEPYHDLDNQGYGWDEVHGYLEPLHDELLAPIADVLDPAVSYSYEKEDGTTVEYDSILAELHDVIDAAVDLDAAEGGEVDEALSEIFEIVKGEYEEFDEENYYSEGGLFVDLGIDGITGDFDSDGGLLTANLGELQAELKTDDETPELLTDLANVFLDDNDQITYEDGDEPVDIGAKAVSAFSEDIDIDPDTVETWEELVDEAVDQYIDAHEDLEDGDVILDLVVTEIDTDDLKSAITSVLETIAGEDDDDDDDDDDDSDWRDEEKTIENLPSHIIAEIGEYITEDGPELWERFDDDHEDPWEFIINSELTSADSGELTGEFDIDDNLGKGSLVTLNNEIQLNLGEAIDIITGADPDSTGITDLDWVAELEAFESEIQIADYVPDSGAEEWDELAAMIDDLLAGFMAEAGLEDPDDPETAYCEYSWGTDEYEDDDESQSPVSRMETGVDYWSGTDLDTRQGNTHITFLGGEDGALYDGMPTVDGMAQFLEDSLTSMAEHIDNNVGGWENLIASDNYGLVNGLDNVPDYSPDVDTPLQQVIDTVVDVLNTLVDDNGDGDGLFPDYAGAHVIELDFHYFKRPPQFDGAEDLANEPSFDDDWVLLPDVDGDGNIGVTDTQLLFEHLDDPRVTDYPAVFNFSSQTPPDEVTIFDVAQHYVQHVHGSE